MTRARDPRRQMAGKRAQRSGDDFEQEIQLANAHYKRHSMGAIEKIPTGVKAVPGPYGRVEFKPVEKTGCDFMGVFQGRAIAMESKSTSKTAFPLCSNGKPMIKPHQLFFLEAYEKAGGESYILIRIGPDKRVFRLEAGIYKDLEELAKGGGKKSIPISWLEDAGKEIERTGYLLDYLEGGLKG